MSCDCNNLVGMGPVVPTKRVNKLSPRELVSQVREAGFGDAANLIEKKINSEIHHGDFFTHSRSGNRYFVTVLGLVEQDLSSFTATMIKG